MKRIIYSIIIGLTLLFSVNLNAQVDRTKAPEPGPTPTIKMGAYTEFELPNGLRVLLVEDHKLPRINVGINFLTDPILEGDKAGYLAFYGSLWSKGTTTKDVDAINEEIDFIGASLNTSRRYIGFSALSKYTDQMMAMMSDVLLNPSFPEDEVAKLKTQIESGLSTVKTDPGSIMSNISKAVFYGDKHAYGDIESAEKLKNFGVKECKEFYNTFIRPNNAVMVIVGDITEKEAKKLVGKYLKKWKKAEVPTFEYDFPIVPKGVNVIFSNKDAASQSSISLAYPIDLTYENADYIPLTVANFILGGGSFQAKLMKNLREDKGFTYGAYSSVSRDRLVGDFSASSEVNVNATDSAFVEIAKEMQNMRDGNFEEIDLARTKSTISGSFSRALESPGTIANYAFLIERNNLPKDYFETYLQKLDAVTMEDIVRVSNKYFDPNNAYYLVVGDKSIIPALEKLDSDGVVLELDYLGQPIEKIEVSNDVTVDGVLNKYLDFIGGAELVKSLKDMSFKTIMNIQGMTIENMSKMILGDNVAFSMVTSMGGNVMSDVKYIDGEANIKSPQGNQVLTGEQAAPLKYQGYPFIEAYVKELGLNVILEEIVEVDGKKAYKVKFDIPGAPSYSFYDVGTGEKLKSISSQGGQNQEQIYKDYKEFPNGIKYATTLKMNMMGMEVEAKVKDVEFNTGLTKESL